MRSIDPRALADSLPDTPQTVLPLHFLGRPGTTVWGDFDPPRNAVVVTAHPQFIFAAGDDPATLGSLLAATGELGRPVWTTLEMAEAVAQALTNETGTVYRVSLVRQKHAHRAPSVPGPAGGDVRLLSPADSALLQDTDEELNWVFEAFGGREQTLRHGLVTAGLVGGRIVSLATTFGRSRLHADIAVHTHTGYRSRGFSTACGAMLMRAILSSRQTPVWTVEDANGPSRRVSEKLGFQLFSSAATLRPTPER